MIPKVVHYCWFGGSEMPELATRCIESWKRYLPDYEFVLWNEKNFNINVNEYVRQAYKTKKYAFVTDYVRLYALYHYGGIYMDTDVEVLRNLDVFLRYRAFTGCEDEDMCVTGIMGAVPYHPWIEKLLKDYNDREFIIGLRRLDLTPNTQRITYITIRDYGFVQEDKYQVLKDDLHIYPSEVFCAKDWRTGEVKVTERTYTIHHFAGSWVDKRKQRIRKAITAILGESGFESLLRVRNSLLQR